MKLQEIMPEVLAEIKDEQEDVVKEILKEKLIEIQMMKLCLDKAEKQLNDLIEMDIVDVIAMS